MSRLSRLAGITLSALAFAGAVTLPSASAEPQATEAVSSAPRPLGHGERV